MKVNEAKLDLAAKTLLAAAPIGSSVLIFGSHARGTAGSESDIDFLVIEPKVDDRLEETYRLRKALKAVFADHIQPIDLVVTDFEHYQRSKVVPNTLAFEAAAEGRFYE